MCSGAVTIVTIGKQYAPEMPFAKDHDMIETYPPNRADETFAAAVLPQCDPAIQAARAGAANPSLSR